MNGYHVYPKQWFSFAFENPDIASGNHGIVYLWSVELNNRLGWVKKFGIPSEVAMAAAGIKSYKTYSRIFEDLIKWGFFEVHQRSSNQYTADIIALVNFTEANTKPNTEAPTKALTNAILTQEPEQYHGSVGIINRPIYLYTNIPINQETEVDADRVDDQVDFVNTVSEEKKPSPKVARKGSPKFDPSKIDLPFSGEGFSAAWLAWIKHRQEIKKPLTETAVDQQLKKLSFFDEFTATALILQTVEKGWQGIVYELRSESKWQPNAPPGKGNIQKNYESVMIAEQRILEKRGLN